MHASSRSDARWAAMTHRMPHVRPADALLVATSPTDALLAASSGAETTPSVVPDRRHRQVRASDARATVGAGGRMCAPLPGQEAQSDGPGVVVGVGIEQADRLPRAEAHPPVDNGHGQRRRRQQRHDVVGPVTGRPVAVAIPAVLAREQSVERVEQVVVRPRTDLDDDQPGRRVRDEQGEQAVLGVDVGEERGARRGQVREPAGRARPDGEVAGLYGKMLRSASRMRPIPPPAGADS